MQCFRFRTPHTRTPQYECIIWTRDTCYNKIRAETTLDGFHKTFE